MFDEHIQLNYRHRLHKNTQSGQRFGINTEGRLGHLDRTNDVIPLRKQQIKVLKNLKLHSAYMAGVSSVQRLHGALIIFWPQGRTAVL